MAPILVRPPPLRSMMLTFWCCYRTSEVDFERREREAHLVHVGDGQLLHRVPLRRHRLQHQRHQSSIRKRTSKGTARLMLIL